MGEQVNLDIFFIYAMFNGAYFVLSLVSKLRGLCCMQEPKAHEYKVELHVELEDGSREAGVTRFWALNDRDARQHLNNVVLPYYGKMAIRGSCSERVHVDEFHRFRWFVPAGQKDQTYELLDVGEE